MTREEKRQRLRLKRHKVQELQEMARGPVDLPFLVLVILLTCIGLIMMFSASFPSAIDKYGDPTYYAREQLISALIGWAAALAMGKINYERLRGFSTLALLGSMILLLFVLVPGLGLSENGATRWLRLFVFFGPTYQPSELAKLGIIIYFASTISQRKERMESFQQGILPYVIILGVYSVLMLLEPHMSGCILLLGIGGMMMIVGGIHRFWIALGGIGVAGGLYIMLFTPLMEIIGYNSSRIQTWRDPWWDVGNKSFQMAQSLISIGSGGLLGVGLGKSRQKFMYLPEEHNDFIFAICCEELGLIGATLILILFALLVIRGYWIAIHARDRFGALLVVGVVTQIGLQVFLNVAVVTGLIPATGISLPFFSYGGTALMIQLFEVGIVLSVSRQMPAPKVG